MDWPEQPDRGISDRFRGEATLAMGYTSINSNSFSKSVISPCDLPSAGRDFNQNRRTSCRAWQMLEPGVDDPHAFCAPWWSVPASASPNGSGGGRQGRTLGALRRKKVFTPAAKCGNV